MRATGSHDVLFEATPLDADAAVDLRAPAAWAAHRDPAHAAWTATLLGTLYHAVAGNARDWFVDWLNQRAPASQARRWRRCRASEEAVGRIDGWQLASRLLLERCAADTDRGEPPPLAQGHLLKLNVTDNAIAAVELAVRLAGNPALARGNPLERHYRDVLCSRIHTPQNDVILTTAGAQALRERAAARRPEGAAPATLPAPASLRLPPRPSPIPCEDQHEPASQHATPRRHHRRRHGRHPDRHPPARDQPCRAGHPPVRAACRSRARPPTAPPTRPTT